MQIAVSASIVAATLALVPGHAGAYIICRGCGTGGGGGGGGSVSASVPGVSSTATGATITWTIYPTSATTSISWGPTSMGAFPYVQSPISVSSAGQATLVLIYLQPETSYSFQISASYSGMSPYTSGNYSFTTPAFVPTTFMNWLPGGGPQIQLAQVTGSVSDGQGNPGPAGLGVAIYCTGNPYWEENGTATTSGGLFSVAIPYPCQNNVYGSSSNDYTVVVVNDPQVTIGQSSWYTWQPYYTTVYHPNQWKGFWNISIDVPLPEPMTFQLLPNVVGPWVPQVVQFSNAPANFATISYTQSVSYSSQVCTPFSNGGENGCSSTTWTAQTSYSTNWGAGSLEYEAQYMASGMALFTASDREWAITSVNDYGSPLHQGFSTPGSSNYIADQLTPSSGVSGMYLLSGCDTVCQNVFLAGGDRITWTLDSAFSSVRSWNIGLGLSMGVPLDEFGMVGGEVGVDTSLTWSQSTSYTVSNAISFTITGGGSDSCYNVYAVGPSDNAAALIIGIYYWNWPHTYSGTSPACFTPS